MFTDAYAVEWMDRQDKAETLHPWMYTRQPHRHRAAKLTESETVSECIRSIMELFVESMIMELPRALLDILWPGLAPHIPGLGTPGEEVSTTALVFLNALRSARRCLSLHALPLFNHSCRYLMPMPQPDDSVNGCCIRTAMADHLFELLLAASCMHQHAQLILLQYDSPAQ